MMPAQQKVGLVRPAGSRGHDHNDYGFGWAAAGAFRPLGGLPVNEMSPGPLQRVPSGNAGMQDVHSHAPRLAARARAGQGLTSRQPGTNGTGWTPEARPRVSRPGLKRGCGTATTTGPGQGHRRINGESQRRAACGIQRQVSADVDPGQAHGGDGDQGDGAAGWG